MCTAALYDSPHSESGQWSRSHHHDGRGLAGTAACDHLHHDPNREGVGLTRLLLDLLQLCGSRRSCYTRGAIFRGSSWTFLIALQTKPSSSRLMTQKMPS